MRSGLAAALLVIAAVVAFAWLGAAVVGGHSFGPVLFGDSANIRLVVWLCLGAWVVHPRRQSLVERGARFFEQHLVVISALCTTWFVAYKVTQFASFNVGSYDMSLYHFAIRHLWSDGPGFAWAFGLERNFFSEHFSLVLFLFVPVDVLFRSSLSLLIAQAVLVSLGAPLSAALARSLGLPRSIGAVLALAYVFNASLWEAFRFDFHPETLIPVSVLAMSWCLVRERFVAFAVTLVLALSIKEDLALVIVPCLFMLGLAERRVRRAASIGAVVCVLWLLLAIGFAIPHAQPNEVTWSMFAARYGNWGATPLEAAAAMLRRPGDVLAVLTDEPVKRLVRIQGYLPLLNPVAALAGLPSILEHRLADYAPQQRLRDYYGVGPAAVWLLAAFFTVRFAQRRFGFGVALILSALPLAIQPRVDPLFVVKPAHREVDAVLRTIPNDASVIAQTTLVPHLPVSPDVKLFGRTELTSDYVVLMPSAFRWPYDDRDEYAREVERHFRPATTACAAMTALSSCCSAASKPAATTLCARC